MQTCPNCNTAVAENAGFCSSCGTKLNKLICPKCKSPVEEGAGFCSSCGTRLNFSDPIKTEKEVSVPPAPKTTSGKLHCPQCGSHNITVTTESSVNGALTTHGGAGSSTVVSNTHRNFWICSDCGTKFRNIQSLEEEIQASKNSPIVAAIIGGISAVIAIWFAIMASTSFLGAMFIPIIVGASVAAIISAIFGITSKKKTDKMKQELQYLKDKCFN